MIYENTKSETLTAPFTQIAELIPNYRPNPNVTTEVIKSSYHASCVLRNVFPVQLEYREAMLALFLNQANHTIGYSTLSIGGLASTTCDPKLLFQSALLCHASAFILCHNHPSGNLRPSNIDLKLTKHIAEGAETLSLKFLDHIILSEGSYYSFADEGEL